MDFALENGVNFFDTAELYDTSKEKPTVKLRKLLVIGLG